MPDENDDETLDRAASLITSVIERQCGLPTDFYETKWYVKEDLEELVQSYVLAAERGEIPG